MKFKRGYKTFGLQAKIPEKNPGLWGMARKLLIAFPSLYLVVKVFSVVTNLLTKRKSRLNITELGDLRLFLTKLKPNYDNLLSIHRVHSSRSICDYFLIVIIEATLRYCLIVFC